MLAHVLNIEAATIRLPSVAPRTTCCDVYLRGSESHASLMLPRTRASKPTSALAYQSEPNFSAKSRLIAFRSATSINAMSRKNALASLRSTRYSSRAASSAWNILSKYGLNRSSEIHSFLKCAIPTFPQKYCLVSDTSLYSNPYSPLTHKSPVQRNGCGGVFSCDKAQ